MGTVRNSLRPVRKLQYRVKHTVVYVNTTSQRPSSLLLLLSLPAEQHSPGSHHVLNHHHRRKCRSLGFPLSPLVTSLKSHFCPPICSLFPSLDRADSCRSSRRPPPGPAGDPWRHPYGRRMILCHLHPPSARPCHLTSSWV